MDNLKSKSIKAFIWDFVGKILTQGMSFIFSIFLARLLSPSEFGLIAMIMVIIGIASVFTDIGLGGALIQRSRLLPVHFSSVFYFNLAIGLLLSIICYVSAGWVAVFYDSPELELLTQVMAVSFVLSAFGSVQATKLRKDLNYAALTRASFIASLLSGGVGVALAFQGAGVWSLVAQNLLMGLVFNVAVWHFSAWRPALAFSFKALKQLWGFGFRMFLVGLLDAIYTRLDYLVIGKLFLPATLGFFHRAKSLNLMVTRYSSGSLMSVLLPVLSQIKNNVPQFKNIVRRTLGIISIISMFIVGSLYLVADELIILLFSDKWMDSTYYFKILVLSGASYPINSLLVSVLSSRGKSKIFLRAALLKKSIGGLNLLNLYLYGIESYLYGLILVSILATSISVFMAARESRIAVSFFYRTIIAQVIVLIVSIKSTQYFFESIDYELSNLFVFMLAKGSIFSIIFITMNLVLRVKAFLFIIEQGQKTLKKRSLR